MESAKQYFKDSPQDFHSVIYERRDVHYPHAYGPGCGVNEKTKRWMDEVKRYDSQVFCYVTVTTVGGNVLVHLHGHANISLLV